MQLVKGEREDQGGSEGSRWMDEGKAARARLNGRDGRRRVASPFWVQSIQRVIDVIDMISITILHPTHHASHLETTSRRHLNGQHMC